MQDLKKQASDVAKEASKKGSKYTDSTQKDAMKKLQTSQSYASKQLEALKKEADSQYKNAQVFRSFTMSNQVSLGICIAYLCCPFRRDPEIRIQDLRH